MVVDFGIDDEEEERVGSDEEDREEEEEEEGVVSCSIDAGLKALVGGGEARTEHTR